MNTFAESGLKTELLDAISDLGFETPTPIQKKAIDVLVNSEDDLIALAQTGTGKTAAFSLPILHHLDVSEVKIQALILAPTRELGLQIAKDIESYTKYLPKIKSLAVYGGSNISAQIKELNKGVHIVIGTPGRTLDLINRKKLKIDSIKWLVLDEADEMLSMGFKDDLDAILDSTPKEKQVLLFSATMPKEIRRIASEYMTSPKEVESERVNMANSMIKHKYFMVSARDRYLALKRLVDVHPTIYGIVFCRTRMETQEVADKLGKDGYSADAIHGDLSQAQRDYVMGRFRTKQIQILVATDVAARGLDVANLTHVINYNLPDDPEVYIHRSGRTGRAGNTGESIIIIHSRERNKIRYLEKKIGKPIEVAKIPTGKEICGVQLFSLIERVKNIEVNEDQISEFMPKIMELVADMDHEELIKKFVSVEFNRFLEYYSGAGDINVTQGSRERDRSKGNSESGYTKYFVNHGTKTGLNPKALINLINEHYPEKKIDIGRIDIQKTVSFFEVDSQYENDLTKAFKNTSYRGLQIYPDRKPVSSGGDGGDRRRDDRGGDRSRRKFGGSESGGKRRGDRGGRGGGYVDNSGGRRSGGGKRSGGRKNKYRD